jgi:HPr kinase/phosphorylase
MKNRHTIHGIFVDIGGSGILITGESGVGKSECVLTLISRGHRLIADDAVIIERVGDLLFGGSPAAISGLLHIRDIGIVDVCRLYGKECVGRRQQIDLCIELRKPDDTRLNDRTAPGRKEFETLGVKIPKYVVIAEPARPLALLVETAASLAAMPGAVLDAETTSARFLPPRSGSLTSGQMSHPVRKSGSLCQIEQAKTRTCRDL